jgi:hypothetical protein
MNDDLTLEDALQLFFTDDKVPDGDGGYSARWATLKMGAIPLAFPNTKGRQAALKLHDLHHIATGYGTDIAGEGQIGAWEVAGGCASHTAAWVLNLLVMAAGLVLAPRECFRAFVRGRQTRNLYRTPYAEALELGTVGALRDHLGLGAPASPALLPDALAFGFWSVVSVALQLVVAALVFGPLVALLWLLI